MAWNMLRDQHKMWNVGSAVRRQLATAVIAVAIIATARPTKGVDAPVQLNIAIHDRLRPADPGQVRFSGRLGEKLNACVQNRLMDQDVQALVAPYRAKAEVGSTDWRCEYWGKWFTAVALADAYEPDTAVARLRDYGCGELLKTAAPDGYLGTRQPDDRTKGWDVWGCKYAMLGLLADYDRTADPAVLKASCREADVLIAELGPGKANIEDIGEWNGLPASSVLEPIVQLYERTGEQKYLQFARHIVASWDQPSKRLPAGMRLIEDAIAGKPPSQMCAPKSYEMMSCFEGLCELYRATGDQADLDAAVALVRSVQAHEVNLVGCGTSNEVWFDGIRKQTRVIPKPMETCVTATWMKLNEQLLRLTGKPAYADELERNLYNALLGAMTPRGDWWAYFSGQMGVRVPSYVQHADVGTSCCVLNGPRGLLITPGWAAMQGPDGPVINLYSPGTVAMKSPAGQDLSLEIQGDYPVSDRVKMVLKLPRPEKLTIGLRIPGWSENTELAVNGEPQNAAPGTYSSINRTWTTGDTLTLGFDMRGRVITAPDGNGQIAVIRGPIVLSLDNRITPAGDGKAVIASGASKYTNLISNPQRANQIQAWMAFDVPFVVDGVQKNLTFCDYADAGSEFSQTNVFRSWLPQPLDLHGMYQCGQTWHTLSHANHWTDVPARPERIGHPADDLALALNGAVASSDSEYAPEAGCTAKVNDGIVARPGDFSNRWHSSVQTPHPHWVRIKLPRQALIGRVVIHFADPDGAAVEFRCLADVNGVEQEVLHVAHNTQTRDFQATFPPIQADAFKLLIESSANPKYPNAAQVSEIELFAPTSDQPGDSPSRGSK